MDKIAIPPPLDSDPTPTPPTMQIHVVQESADLLDDVVGLRGVIVKSSRRDRAALEVFFHSDKASAVVLAKAFSGLTRVVCGVGPVGWDI